MSVILSLLLAGCGSAEAPQTPAPEVPEAPAKAEGAKEGHEGHGEMKHDGDAAGAFAALEGEDKRVFFVAPADGATVGSPVALSFGAEGVEIKPAGTMDANTGHHHIIIDGAPVAAGTVVPADDTHIHYGKGQLGAEIPLEPGQHTLTLQLADGMHRSYGPDMSATITVTVEAGGEAEAAE